MIPITDLRRQLCTLGGLTLLLLSLTSCNLGDAFFAPAPAPENRIALTLALRAAPNADPARVSALMGNADHVWIQALRGGASALDTLVALQSGKATSIVLRVPIVGVEELLTLNVEVRQASGALLEGAAEVVLRRSQVAEAEVALSPSSALLGSAKAVSAGIYHSCAALVDGRTACWGAGESGQLGRDPVEWIAAPSYVATLPGVQAVEAGFSSSCGLTTGGLTPDGRVYCWGANDRGQLGVGSSSGSPIPGALAGALRFQTLSMSGLHACALTAEGQAYCWGLNSEGQLGDGTTADRTVPTAAAGALRFRSISTGYLHSCAITLQGESYCWGRNDHGQLGAESGPISTAPLRVETNVRFTALSAGGLHSCGLAEDQRVYCWGYNAFGQLGVGSTQDVQRPTEVRTTARFRQLSAGGAHSCALDTTGRALCWGYNRSGALGDGTFEQRITPVALSGAPQLRSISAGLHHSCAVDESGRVLCWGYNVYGQVGDGSRADRASPTAVSAVRPSGTR